MVGSQWSKCVAHYFPVLSFGLEVAWWAHNGVSVLHVISLYFPLGWR